MSLSKEAFEDVLRQAYPEGFERAQTGRRSLQFAALEQVPDPVDRQAAVIMRLTSEWQWTPDEDRDALAYLASQGRPTVDLENFSSYRGSQTILVDPSNGALERVGPGETEWWPQTEPPSSDPARLAAGREHTVALVDEALQQTKQVQRAEQVQQPVRFLDAQPAPGSQVPISDQGAAQHTGGRLGDPRQNGQSR
jgi:hypothetical protein